MIVFWKEYQRGNWGQGLNDWRVYIGRARHRNGRMHVYPCNGKRKALSQFIAFNDKTRPPTMILGGCSEAMITDDLTRVGPIAEHLPATFIDSHGNIRRTDSSLSLVLSGPKWGPLQEDEFQQAIWMPF